MRVYGLVLRYKLFVVVSLALLLGVLSSLVFEKAASGAGALPMGFEQTQFANGFSKPTAMAFAPDGRLFVAEQEGTLRVIKDGQLLTTPFLDISGKIDAKGERGLLGVAFDPDFSTNNYVYVYYTQKATGTTPTHNLVARFTADGDVATAGSETTIFRLPKLKELNHNGGAIHFGGDGELYVAVGENRREKAAQSLKTVLGKMLRINKDGTVPTDNPFYAKTTGSNKAIWAMGFRNPFSFAVQPGTGRIFINDVGQSRWEEVDEGKPGANYGWPRYEGPENNPSYEGPIFAYHHGFSETTGCAITGGTFYDPGTGASAPFPAEYEGSYFFADFCSGWIRKLDPATNMVEGFKASSDEHPVDLKVGSDGDLYFLARGTASVERIHYTLTP